MKTILLILLPICLVQSQTQQENLQKTLKLLFKQHNTPFKPTIIKCVNDDQSNIIISEAMKFLNKKINIDQTQFAKVILEKVNTKTQQCLRNSFALNMFLQNQGSKNINQMNIQMKQYTQEQEAEIQKQSQPKIQFNLQSQIQVLKNLKIMTKNQNSQLRNMLKNDQKAQCANLQTKIWDQAFLSQLNKYRLQHPQLKFVQQKMDHYFPLKQQTYKPQYHFKPVNITPQQIKFASQLRTLTENPNNIQLSSKQYSIYESKYQISKYDELPFCVVVTSYNNMKEKVYKRNLNSILQQNYTNYHVIYIDDTSPDGTFYAVKQYLKNHPLRHKVQLVQNNVNIGNPINFMKAAKDYCKPNEIFFRVDGDDQIIGKQSLKLFNAIYQKHDSWVVYAASIQELCKGKPIVHLSSGFSAEVAQNNDFRYHRMYPFFGQISCYNQIMRRINLSDLRSEKTGEYYKNAGDAAISWPMLEMAGKFRISYIPQITHYYNILVGDHDAVNTEGARKQAQTLAQLKYGQKYSPIKQLFSIKNRPIKMKVSHKQDQSQQLL